MKWTVRLTGIYILSCAICVSELCRVTVRRIRSGKSVIITRATLAEASLLFPPTSSSPLSHPPPFTSPVSTLGSPSPSVTLCISSPSLYRVESLFPPFFPILPLPYPPHSLSLSLVSSGRKLAARSNLRLVTPSTSDNGGVCPALAARNARREKINNGDPHHGLIRQEIPPPFFHETVL